MFALPTPTAGKVRTINLRTEMHGDANVHAFDIGVRITGPSSLLDLLHSSLREQLYLPPIENQASIPGEVPPWTVLRCDAVPGVAVKHELVGRNVTLAPSVEIESVMRNADELQLTDCNVNKFHVTAHQGGSVDIDFRIQCSDIDAEAIGMAGAMLQQEVKVAITHTEVAPNQAAPTEAPPRVEADATSLFAEGGAAAEPAQKTTLSPEAAWPFPKGEVAAGAPPKLTTKDVTGRARKGESAPAVKTAAKKLPMKYRNAATGETWSGRGLMPKWLKVGIDKPGKTLADFAV